ncbi:MAG: hypothetical protein FD123_892 [Bacteroidetes bacterium]|nr:MAG: hypothetical protein FD123_892 [Bacteroidota bacterium]
MEQNQTPPGNNPGTPQGPLYADVRDNDFRGKAVMLVFWILFAVAAIGFVIYLYTTVAVMENDYFPDTDATAYASLAIQFHGIVNLVILILTMVFFIMWFRRAYYNLHAINYRTLRYTEGWAAGAWFIPFLNLAWPYQIMSDIWHATQHAVQVKTGIVRPIQSASIVGWWWGIYLANNFTANILSRLDPEQMVPGQAFIGFPLEFLSIFLTIQMIRQARVFEAEFYREFNPLAGISPYVVNHAGQQGNT